MHLPDFVKCKYRAATPAATKTTAIIVTVSIHLQALPVPIIQS